MCWRLAEMIVGDARSRLNVFHSRSNEPTVSGSSSAARSEVMTTLIAQVVRFARPNIQIYDAHVVDLYQWVRTRYLVGVKVQIQKQSAI